MKEGTPTEYARLRNKPGGGGTPGGSTTQVQFNDGGAFAGDSGLTWDKTNNVLTVTTNSTTDGISITGDNPRYNITGTNPANTPGFVMYNSSGQIGSLFIGGASSGFPNKIGFYFQTANFTFLNALGTAVVNIDQSGNMSVGSITGSGTVPSGGTTGQVLKKLSNANYDVGWV